MVLMVLVFLERDVESVGIYSTQIVLRGKSALLTCNNSRPVPLVNRAEGGRWGRRR